MKISYLDQKSFDPEDVVYRNSWRPVIVGYAVFSIFAVLFLVVLFSVEISMSAFSWYQVVLGLYLIFLVLLFRWLSMASGAFERSGNWVLCLSRKDFSLNIWNCLSKSGSLDSLDVVEFSYNEVISVNRVWYPMPLLRKMINLQIFRQQALEIIISERDYLKLDEHIKRALKFPHNGRKCNFYLERKGSLVVPWTGIVPVFDEMYKTFDKKINVAALKEQTRPADHLEEAQGEKGIFYLVRRGEMMKAIVLAKEVLGISTDEARKLVETIAKQVHDNLE